MGVWRVGWEFEGLNGGLGGWVGFGGVDGSLGEWMGV